MYVYCVTPSGELKSNFIKIGFCNDFNSLKKRYSTYYGLIKIYHVKVDLKKREFEIHKELKDMKLHITKELFKYDDKYNYNFYKERLDKLSKKCENKIIDDNDIINNKENNTTEEELFQNDDEDENDIIKSINELAISEINSENINMLPTLSSSNDNINISPKNEKYQNLENAIHLFRESINEHNRNYIDILLYSILHDIKNNREDNEIYKMHNLKDKGKFNQKTERCNLFIKLINEKEIKINFTKLSPDFLIKLNRNVFDSFLEYIKKKY